MKNIKVGLEKVLKIRLPNDKMVLEVDEVLFEEEPHEFGFTLRFAQKSNRK